ncbi:hypothetical protein [Longispora albida]|uniref:hypothetical protein n=1 Tax=Longispora albida TaxID=203523 RepID=UPI0003AA1C74|nr:hypothetical protein [Longispora albida]
MSSGVSIGGEPAQYYWCLRHHRVETDDGDLCPGAYRLGPYATAEEAATALERHQQREAQLEAEDARWEGERD